MKVAVIMGSKSDYKIMHEATEILQEFGIQVVEKIVSAHRTPSYMYEFAKNVTKEEINLIIAGAGGSAHLPGMVAALTTVPVIGVPIQSKSLNGWDSLLSIVQMPKGIPVATVAINGSTNAGLLAISILSITDKILLKKLEDFRKAQTNKVLQDEVLNDK